MKRPLLPHSFAPHGWIMTPAMAMSPGFCSIRIFSIDGLVSTYGQTSEAAQRQIAVLVSALVGADA